MLLKRYLLFILLIFSLNCYSEDIIRNDFNILFTLKPEIENQTIYRGATLSWSRYIDSNINWGISLRILNQEYTSMWFDFGLNIETGSRFSIPLSLGTGLKIQNLEKVLNSDTGGLDGFIHGMSGLEWAIDPFWSYILHISYNYNLFTDDKHSFFTSIGLKYLF